MGLFDIFKKGTFFNGRSTEGLQDDDLDFEKWINAHRKWRLRLQAYIQGESKEELDEHAICHDDRCDLGKWLHGNGKKFYNELPVYQRLVTDHATFHRSAGEVVAKFKQEGEKEARRTLTGEFDMSSLRVIDGLSELERKVKQ